MPKKIEIYTWDTCPYCQKALKLLRDKSVIFTQHKVDGDDETRFKLAEKSGRKSVPQIFVDGNFIGGCDDIHALDSQNKLDEILGC